MEIKNVERDQRDVYFFAMGVIRTVEVIEGKPFSEAKRKSILDKFMAKASAKLAIAELEWILKKNW